MDTEKLISIKDYRKLKGISRNMVIYLFDKKLIDEKKMDFARYVVDNEKSQNYQKSK
jgi:hypothetical protein